MAINAIGFWLSVTLVDKGGEQTTKSYELVAADYPTAITDSATIVSALQGVTDLVVQSYRICELYAEDSLELPLGEVQKENQALLLFDIDGNPLKRATHAIPGAKSSIFVSATGPNSNVVDVSNADVVAYRSLFQQGGQAYISDGEEANILLSGRRRHVRNRRG